MSKGKLRVLVAGKRGDTGANRGAAVKGGLPGAPAWAGLQAKDALVEG
jgi:hypothetical protein